MRKFLAIVCLAFAVSCSRSEPPPAEQAPATTPEAAEAPAKAPEPEVAVPQAKEPAAPKEDPLGTPIEYVWTVLRGLSARERIKRDAVQGAVQQYKALEERYPKDVEEMRKARFDIPRLGRDMDYRIDQNTGKVTIVKRVPKE